MTDTEEERLVDHVIVECGTLPRDALYMELKEGSTNHGQTDLPTLLQGRTQPAVEGLKNGEYALFRIGDAVAGRNIHAALYDALRLCKDF